MPSTEQRWTKIASALLLNRKIVKVRYLSENEAIELDWSQRCVVLQLDNGMLVYPSADDEGNGAGALFTTDKKESTLPVI